jgi:hypothetical protein
MTPAALKEDAVTPMMLRARLACLGARPAVLGLIGEVAWG